MFQEQPTQLPSLGAEAFTTGHDIIYASRDRDIDGVRELQIYRIARLVDNWSTNLTVCPRLLFEIESWDKALSGPGLEDDLTLGFDLKWLDFLIKFLPDNWCTLHHILSRSVAEPDKYKIMIFLSTLSYSQHAKQELVQTVLAFATIPELRILQPPDHSMFQLSGGYRPRRERLVIVVKGHARQFYECPEYYLPNLPFENYHLADQRRRQEHQVAKGEQIRMFAEDLMAQWPEANISTPRDTNHSTYILVDEATESACVCFQSWH